MIRINKNEMLWGKSGTDFTDIKSDSQYTTVENVYNPLQKYATCGKGFSQNLMIKKKF